MKRPFIDELTELCTERGYRITAVDIAGEVVEVRLENRKETVTPVDERQHRFPEFEEVKNG